MAKGKDGGRGAEEAAELWVLNKKNALKDFEVAQDAKVFVCKGYYFVEIVGLVEKLAGLNTYHYVHVPVALKN